MRTVVTAVVLTGIARAGTAQADAGEHTDIGAVATYGEAVALVAARHADGNFSFMG
ncbi:hypothetical protein ACFRI7_30065 [Streptomyces sp. NPDC056716]|uniref:hypothetical protein n=1 Tax=unclassified Streptomyces TaxID=2593676 RepID=UPI00367F34D4